VRRIRTERIESGAAKTMDPKGYLEYLDKEMTIMGLLSAFAVAVTSFATERTLNAEKGFLNQIAAIGKLHVLAGAASALLAALFFYLQRSHLAWYYGQTTLAQARGASSPASVEDWLTWSDGWDGWLSYQTGFAVLTLSIFYYAYAVAETLFQKLSTVSPLNSILLPFLAVVVIESTRWYVLKAFPQEDRPYEAWYKSMRGR